MRCKKHWLTLLILLGFTTIYMLKITGHFDFTAKYDIYSIHSNKEDYNCVLMLDGEEKTTWGQLCRQEVGDYIEIRFKKTRGISGIVLDYGDFPEDALRSAIIVYSQDGIDWQATHGKIEKNSKYVFDYSVTAQYLKIIVGNDENLTTDAAGNVKLSISELEVF